MNFGYQLLYVLDTSDYCPTSIYRTVEDLLTHLPLHRSASPCLAAWSTFDYQQDPGKYTIQSSKPFWPKLATRLLSGSFIASFKLFSDFKHIRFCVPLFSMTDATQAEWFSTLICFDSHWWQWQRFRYPRPRCQESNREGSICHWQSLLCPCSHWASGGNKHSMQSQDVNKNLNLILCSRNFPTLIMNMHASQEHSPLPSVCEPPSVRLIS